jgi:hypothetical protein
VKTFRYETSLITTLGSAFRLVEERQAFSTRREAIAYATAGLERFGVQVVRVTRLKRVEVVSLFRADRVTEEGWADDGQAFERRRYATQGEIDAWRAEGDPDKPSWALQ